MIQANDSCNKSDGVVKEQIQILWSKTKLSTAKNKDGIAEVRSSSLTFTNTGRSRKQPFNLECRGLKMCHPNNLWFFVNTPVKYIEGYRRSYFVLATQNTQQ